MQLKWTLALGFSRLFGQNAPGKCSQVKVSSREFTFGFVPQPNWIEAMPGKTVTVGMLVPLSKKTFRKAPIDNYITNDDCCLCLEKLWPHNITMTFHTAQSKSTDTRQSVLGPMVHVDCAEKFTASDFQCFYCKEKFNKPIFSTHFPGKIVGKMRLDCASIIQSTKLPPLNLRDLMLSRVLLNMIQLLHDFSCHAETERCEVCRDAQQYLQIEPPSFSMGEFAKAAESFNYDQIDKAMSVIAYFPPQNVSQLIVEASKTGYSTQRWKKFMSWIDAVTIVQNLAQGDLKITAAAILNFFRILFETNLRLGQSELLSSFIVSLFAANNKANFTLNEKKALFSLLICNLPFEWIQKAKQAWTRCDINLCENFLDDDDFISKSDEKETEFALALKKETITTSFNRQKFIFEILINLKNSNVMIKYFDSFFAKHAQNPKNKQKVISFYDALVQKAQFKILIYAAYLEMQNELVEFMLRNCVLQKYNSLEECDFVAIMRYLAENFEDNDFAQVLKMFNEHAWQIVKCTINILASSNKLISIEQAIRIVDVNENWTELLQTVVKYSEWSAQSIEKLLSFEKIQNNKQNLKIMTKACVAFVDKNMQNLIVNGRKLQNTIAFMAALHSEWSSDVKDNIKASIVKLSPQNQLIIYHQKLKIISEGCVNHVQNEDAPLLACCVSA